jgi:hypothetical protein
MDAVQFFPFAAKIGSLGMINRLSQCAYARREKRLRQSTKGAERRDEGCLTWRLCAYPKSRRHAVSGDVRHDQDSLRVSEK